MQGYNCIMVFNKMGDELLFCKRTKDPYMGLYNLVGGKIEVGEDEVLAAYRELEEETGISSKHIQLSHMMDFTYYNQNCYVQVYTGYLKEDVALREEAHPLEWLPVSEDFFDRNRFAGEGNIGHMMEQVKQYGMGLPYTCICSDLDGTLLASNHAPTDATVEVLSNLARKGVSIVPATGRSYYSIPEDIMNLPGVKYVIASNGAAIYDVESSTAIYQSFLEAHVAEQIFRLLDETDYTYTYEVFVEGIPYTARDYFEDPLKYGALHSSVTYVKETRKPVDDIRKFIIEHKHCLDAFDVILLPQNRQAVYELIEKNIPGIYMTTSTPYLIEISHIHSGKHNGLLELSKITGIPIQAMIAMGDGDNDSEMLSLAGLGIAVMNATPKCMESADLICGSNDEDGIANILKEIFQL